ncbi:RHS repeat-associated core domain-containing protein, partial [Aeromicrobium alkaliterrae]|uniref:RHS repeat-associated core domain-containing protein n=1 Tax=Aeromicrobium alkaliterrae TaxID=302168 RepID=UPI0031D05969
DAVDNLISYHQIVSGQPADVTNYAYDDANRPNLVQNAFGFTQIASDDDGRTKTITFPEQAGYPGTRLDYDYTNAGQPELMTWKTRDNASLVAKWDYKYTKTIPGTSIVVDTPQQQSRQVTSSFVTAGTTTYSYSQQRLMSATDTAGPDYTYTYDNVGNILSEKIDTTTTHYGYDKAGELCWQGGTAGTTAQKLSLTCAAGPAGSTPFTSDAAGNNLGTTGAPLTYNDDSQVTAVGGKTQTYLDQGNDLRTKSATTLLINGPLGITAFKEGGQTVYISRLPDGTPLTSRPTYGTQSYFITEQDGSVAFLVDPFGYNVGSYTYSPYGKTTLGPGVSQYNPFRWVGQWQETTASGDPGLYKLGARYYSTTGHFTQPDAMEGNLGDPRTMTAYNYAGGDPINQADPSGYSAVDRFKKFVKKADGALGKAGQVIGVAEVGYNLYKRRWKKAAAKATGLVVGGGVGAGCSAAASATGVGVAAVPICGTVGGVAGDLASKYVEKNL